MKFSAPLFVLFLLLASCHSKNASKQQLVTERIQYDVPISTHDPELDWWVRNIEGSKRETFVKQIVSAVEDGKVKAYDFFTNSEFTKEEIKNMLCKVDTLTVERFDGTLVDTAVKKELQLKDICRMRFLEEWSINPKTLEMQKRVLGICPIAEKRAENDSILGYQPLFWVFFDAEYPNKLKLSNQ